MDIVRPRTAPTQKPNAAQRPQTAPSARGSGKSADGLYVRFSEQSIDEIAPVFWAIPTPEPASEIQDIVNSEKPPAASVAAAESGQDKRVSFKNLHLEKAAIDEYHMQQRKMALTSVTSIYGWEETKNSLIASIQNLIRPDISLSEKHRKSVLNSILNNFFAILHIPNYSALHPNFNDELHEKVPNFLLQLEKDVQERNGMERTVDLGERETQKGILGTYGKQFLVEAFISGISLARDDEESDFIVRRAALNEEYRKLQLMKNEVQSMHSALTGQRIKHDEVLAQLKTKDLRIEQLERLAQRRDASYADQTASFIREIHSLKANYSKATSIAKATTHGIQNALMTASTINSHHQVSQTAQNSGERLLIESLKIQQSDLENKKALDAEHKNTLAVQERRILMLEEALCTAQAINVSESHNYRSSLAKMINWASSTLKFEEDVFNLVERSFRSDASTSIMLNVAGKQLHPPNSAEKLTSLLALTQELSKVSIEVSKITSQKLINFNKLSTFALDLVSFIAQKGLFLPADLELAKQDLLSKNSLNESEAIMMFPEGISKGQKTTSTEDVELNRILGKERTAFRNSLLDLLLEMQKKTPEAHKNHRPKTDHAHSPKQIQDTIIDRDISRKDMHDTLKSEQLKGKNRSVSLQNSPSLSSNHASSSQNPHISAAAFALHQPKPSPTSVEKTHSMVDSPTSVQPPLPHDEQLMATVTKQRDDYMERLSALSLEMQQLQTTLREIQRQRTEIMAKTTAESDEMAAAVGDLKRERDMLLEKLASVSGNTISSKGVTDSICTCSVKTMREEIVTKQIISTQIQSHGSAAPCQEKVSKVKVQTSDAICQTITLPSVSLMHHSETSGLSAIADNMKPSESLRPTINESNIASDCDSKTLKSTAAQMIFNATHRNLQTNILSQRVASVCDEFDEGPRSDEQKLVSVPKIDLSRAFLHSLGDSQANHFHQQGSYLPRFQKLSIKPNINQNDCESHMGKRMTKTDEDFMTTIAPLALPSGALKKRKPGVAVVEIPNLLDIPASQFSQPPYTSRPSTSSHRSLYVGVDIGPETCRAPNKNNVNKPHRPSTHRSQDSKPSARFFKGMQSIQILEIDGTRTSPTNHQGAIKQATRTQENPILESSDHFTEVATHSEIINDYLKDINHGVPS